MSVVPTPSSPAAPLDEVSLRAGHLLLSRARLLTLCAVLMIVCALPFFVPLKASWPAYLAVLVNCLSLFNGVMLFRLSRRLGRTPMQYDVAAAGVRRGAVLVLLDGAVPFLAIGATLVDLHSGDYGPSVDALGAMAAFVAALVVVPIWTGIRVLALFSFAGRLEQEPFRGVIERGGLGGAGAA